MPAPSAGLHHITAICSDPQANIDFYTQTLGLRLVKVAVNFDEPDTYHLYYGDAEGRPGTAMTFFAIPPAAPGQTGAGTGSAVAFTVPDGALAFWQERLAAHDVATDGPHTAFGQRYLGLADPDGLRLVLVEDDALAALGRPWTAVIGADRAITGFHGVTAIPRRREASAQFLQRGLGFQPDGEEAGESRYAASGEADVRAPYVTLAAPPRHQAARMGAGSLHHVAFRANDDAHELALQQAIRDFGLEPTPQIERFYFRSVYFREPGGVLYEIATDPPGFTRDEPLESLGTSLCLPPQHAGRREAIAAALPRIRLPSNGQIIP